jgi:diacylglycerol kinase family enzyme
LSSSPLAAAALTPPAAPRGPRRLLVFVSPASGRGRAEELWRSRAAPLLADAGCACEVVVTQRAGQAAQHVRELEWPRLRALEGVLAVGGDGALAEVVQGIMARRDWRRAARRLVLGALPAGSGNGLALSLLHAAGVESSFQGAALLVAKGGAQPLDIASVFVAGGAGAEGGAAGASSGSSAVFSPLATSAVALASASAASVASVGASKDVGHGGALTLRAPPELPALRAQQQTVVVVEPAGFGASTVAGSAGAAAAAAPPRLALDAAAHTAGPLPHAPHALHASQASHAAATASALRRGLWGARLFSFLSLEWAIVADIDLESERLRCLGESRFDVYGALRGLLLRRYRGTFCYLPADRAQCAGKAWWGLDGRLPGDVDGAEGGAGGAAGGAAGGLVGVGGSGGGAGSGARSPRASPLAASRAVGFEADAAEDAAEDALEEAAAAAAGGAAKAASSSAAATADALPSLRHLVPFDQPAPLSWRSLEGVFTLLWVTNTTHQSKGVAVAPRGVGASHKDGVFSVVLVRDVSPLGMLRVLLALDEGGSVHGVPGVVALTCAAWRLEPAPPAPGSAEAAAAARGEGFKLALDGEQLPYGAVQAEVHAGLLRVYG